MRVVRINGSQSLLIFNLELVVKVSHYSVYHNASLTIPCCPPPPPRFHNSLTPVQRAVKQALSYSKHGRIKLGVAVSIAKAVKLTVLRPVVLSSALLVAAAARHAAEIEHPAICHR